MRFDFELTKAELLKERFTDTYTGWCKDLGVLSRAQAYELSSSFDTGRTRLTIEARPR